MNELYELKEMLMRELEKYGKEELTAGTLDVVDKLSHAIKNLCKIIEDKEYSGESYNYNGSYRRGRSYDGRSYARGRNARRDSRGRYSSDYSMDEDFMSELHELMEESPDEQTKKEFKRFIDKIEHM